MNSLWDSPCLITLFTLTGFQLFPGIWLVEEFLRICRETADWIEEYLACLVTSSDHMPQLFKPEQNGREGTCIHWCLFWCKSKHHKECLTCCGLLRPYINFGLHWFYGNGNGLLRDGTKPLPDEWSNADMILSNKTLGTLVKLEAKHKHLFQENTSEIIVWKMVAILFRPQYD